MKHRRYLYRLVNYIPNGTICVTNIQKTHAMEKTIERGRPRNFDINKALQSALVVFWQNGYQGSSLADLTEAMGINKPSLYATFGDKSSLYMKALELYGEQQGKRHLAAMAQQSETIPAIRAFLTSVASMLTSPQLPGGCFVVNGATDCGSVAMPNEVAEALSAAVNATVDAFRQRLMQDADQEKPLGLRDVKAAADYLGTVMFGMSVMAKTGASKKRLLASVDLALAAIDV